MSTATPSEQELRELLKSLYRKREIYANGNTTMTNRIGQKTNETLIAEVDVSINWVKYLLQEPPTDPFYYKTLLPGS